MKVERQEFIKREDLRANPHKAFVFGDNLRKTGSAGQAREMRGEPNAIGIPTKKAPGMNPEDFFTDAEYVRNVLVIDAALSRLEDYDIVVLPAAAHGAVNLGTGLAQLPARAPKTYAYLQEKLRKLDKFNRFVDRQIERLGR